MSPPRWKEKYNAKGRASRRGENGLLAKVSQIATGLKKCAKERGIYVAEVLRDNKTLTDYLLLLFYRQGGCCAITHRPLSIHSLRGITVDRIDSRFGYIPGNLQLTTNSANSRKGSSIADTPETSLASITYALARYPELRPIAQSLIDFYSD